MTYKDIKIYPYDPLWAKQFEEEKSLITQALGDGCMAVYHVGSTSIPGIFAKPQIDIVAVINKGCDPIPLLEAAGFTHKGEWNIPMKYGCSKNREYKVNLHVFHEGHPEIEPQLLFPAYLRSHPEVRDAYAALKAELLKDESNKYKNHNPVFSNYTLGKHAFVLNVLKQAGYKGLRFVKAAHHQEWEAVKRFRIDYNLQNGGDLEDKKAWSLNFADHHHFILYEGIEIAGYAHLELRPKGRVKEWIFILDPRYKTHAPWFKEYLNQWIEFKTGKLESERECSIL